MSAGSVALGAEPGKDLQCLGHARLRVVVLPKREVYLSVAQCR